MCTTACVPRLWVNPPHEGDFVLERYADCLLNSSPLQLCHKAGELGVIDLRGFLFSRKGTVHAVGAEGLQSADALFLDFFVERMEISAVTGSGITSASTRTSPASSWRLNFRCIFHLGAARGHNRVRTFGQGFEGATHQVLDGNEV